MEDVQSDPDGSGHDFATPNPESRGCQGEPNGTAVCHDVNSFRVCKYKRIVCEQIKICTAVHALYFSVSFVHKRRSRVFTEEFRSEVVICHT